MRPEGRTACGFSQERRQAGDGVFRGSRSPSGTELASPFACLAIARTVAGDAADLVIQVLARATLLAVGALVPHRSGRSQEVDQRLDLRRLVGVAGEQVGHGRARLDRLRIVQELLEVADPDAARHGIEDRCLFPRGGSIAGLMAADAVQLAEQQLPAPGPIGLRAGVEALETGDDRMTNGALRRDSTAGQETGCEYHEQQTLPETKHHGVPHRSQSGRQRCRAGVNR